MPDGILCILLHAVSLHLNLRDILGLFFFFFLQQESDRTVNIFN